MSKEFDVSDLNVKMASKILIGVIIGVVALVIIFGSFYTIGAGERGVLLTWGNPSPKEIWRRW